MAQQSFEVSQEDIDNMNPQAKQIAIMFAKTLQQFKEANQKKGSKVVFDSTGKKIDTQAKRNLQNQPEPQAKRSSQKPVGEGANTVTFDARIAAVWNNEYLPDDIKYNLTNSIGRETFGEHWVEARGGTANNGAGQPPKKVAPQKGAPQKASPHSEIPSSQPEELKEEGGGGEPVAEVSLLSFLGIDDE